MSKPTLAEEFGAPTTQSRKANGTHHLSYKCNDNEEHKDMWNALVKLCGVGESPAAIQGVLYNFCKARESKK